MLTYFNANSYLQIWEVFLKLRPAQLLKLCISLLYERSRSKIFIKIQSQVFKKKLSFTGCIFTLRSAGDLYSIKFRLQFWNEILHLYFHYFIIFIDLHKRLRLANKWSRRSSTENRREICNQSGNWNEIAGARRSQSIFRRVAQIRRYVSAGF